MGEVCHVPLGVDFPAAVVAGLRARMADQPPEAMARVTLFLNTARMRRRVVELFVAQGAGFLPRIHLLGDLAALTPDLPDAVPPLRRRLELARLITALLAVQPDLAPRAALFDLADSLAELMGEMQQEDVPAEAIAALDVSHHSAHWARTQAFLNIVAPLMEGEPDATGRERLAALALAHRWRVHPPPGPVIVAGSTGSRGTTALFMRAVAGLEQGVLILPGFDTDLPLDVWDSLSDAMTAEDHPQYRFHRLLTDLGLSPAAVRPWTGDAPVAAARNRLVSLSLRPAPVTDQWLAEGPTLGDLRTATAAMTLIEAPRPRAEALAIALVLRRAAEEGRRAALISPDRNLTRQVTAALDRWGIRPDDSAGTPLAQSAPGRLMRHVARLMGQRLTPETLLILLKHPLAATGADRGNHLRWTRELELTLRRKGPAFPDADGLLAWARARDEEGVEAWAAWIGTTLEGLDTVGPRDLAAHLEHHLTVLSALAAGPGQTGSGDLWANAAGAEALSRLSDLEREAGQDEGHPMSPADYVDLFDSVLARGEVREPVQSHPGIMIWGTLEARVQGADLMILGGLNDGIWPAMPTPDPWLNRQMRLDAGLLLPERQIGLSAHDYQQAIAAPEVILTRSVRDAEAETVPSRWLNRMQNLMSGLPANHGPQALRAMQARGDVWLDMAERVDAPDAPMPPAHRPAPRPPVAARPRELPVTAIARLIRDPYAVYARSILSLFPLDPLRHTPDARLRGEVLHKILEIFVREGPDATRKDARARLSATTDRVLDDLVPWPAARALWAARMDRAADFFLDQNAGDGTPLVLDRDRGRMTLTGLDFTLTARPDRIDRLSDGRLHIIDYKTGTPPTAKQQAVYDKQLSLTALIAAEGGFAFGPSEVARVSYIGLGTNPKIEATEITDEFLGQEREKLHALIGRYAHAEQGYTSRRALFESRLSQDYDHLARFGEWEMQDPSQPEDVGHG
ncbi:double-strand break repair protein AddB [Falsirhodobacter halotolerans]|uniref:double-strand break repair protein AddB n=1 Tax=Falsirhodobacter halotolerans TaxID=1146892 RepID=UPI001FD43CF8|nr:double-strand break repair protein AddB [Falsirhodobacter halotolerans]MCJ8140827.1 double-strand break repair protein AddB [Falsirhodobacter halotolerans]